MENGLEEREEKESKRGVDLQRNTLPLQILHWRTFFFFFFFAFPSFRSFFC